MSTGIQADVEISTLMDMTSPEEVSLLFDTGWMVVEAEQDPVIANPLEYALKAHRYIKERSGL